MTIVRHPTLPAQKDVPDDQAGQWVAAGWVDQGKKSTAETKPATKPRASRRRSKKPADHN